MIQPRVPDAMQRKREARSGALLIRDPGFFFQWRATGVPGLRRTASRCAAPGTRVERFVS